MTVNIAGLLLAAGQSSRMSIGNKLLLKINNKALLEQTISNLKKSDLENIIGVIGHEKSKISVYFKIDSDPHFEHDMAISINNKLLIYRESLRGSGVTFKKMNDYTRTLSNKGPYFINKGFDLKKLAARLKEAEKLFIRTIDGCGKQIDLNFDMNGFAEQITKIPSFLDG